MAITSLALVRRRIGDSLKDETETFVADDSGQVTLAHKNVSIYNVYLDSTVVEPTDYTVEESTGVIVFGENIVSADQTIIVSYGYKAFTDDELNDLITDRGVNGACLEAVRWLMADAAKLHDYSRGATSQSLSQVLKNLQALAEEFKSMGGLDDSENDGDSPSGQVQVRKRTNNFYRGRTDVPFDLTRDDSLNI